MLAPLVGVVDLAPPEGGLNQASPVGLVNLPQPVGVVHLAPQVVGGSNPTGWCGGFGPLAFLLETLKPVLLLKRNDEIQSRSSEGQPVIVQDLKREHLTFRGQCFQSEVHDMHVAPADTTEV